MNYYRELAFELRLRGVDDDQIVSALDDVAAHSRDAETDPRTVFGEPEAFAAGYEQRSPRTLGRGFAMWMTVVAIVMAIGSLVVARALELSIRVGVVSVPLILAIVCIVIGLVGGFVLDRRLPRGFTVPRPVRD